MTQSIPVWIDELPVWLRRALEQRLLPASVGQVTRKLLTELGDQIDPNAVASAVVGAYRGHQGCPAPADVHLLERRARRCLMVDHAQRCPPRRLPVEP